jgi:1,2-phenylacetyl-CoA epoxidase PaaB subunit
MHEAVYDVFARKSRGEPLHHIGYLDAVDDELARIYAWKTYDEENWFEMCIVRRSHIIPVNRSDGPFGEGMRRTGGAGEVRAIPAAQPYGGES